MEAAAHGAEEEQVKTMIFFDGETENGLQQPGRPSCFCTLTVKLQNLDGSWLPAHHPPYPTKGNME